MPRCPDAQCFRDNIRGYNSTLAFTSIGMTSDGNNNQGIYTFRIAGEARHIIGSILPPPNMGEIDEKESLIFLIFNMSTLKSCGTETVTVIKNPFGPYQNSMIPSTFMKSFSKKGHNTMMHSSVNMTRFHLFILHPECNRAQRTLAVLSPDFRVSFLAADRELNPLFRRDLLTVTGETLSLAFLK